MSVPRPVEVRERPALVRRRQRRVVGVLLVGQRLVLERLDRVREEHLPGARSPPRGFAASAAGGRRRTSGRRDQELAASLMRRTVVAQQSRATASVTALPGSTCAPGSGSQLADLRVARQERVEEAAGVLQLDGQAEALELLLRGVGVAAGEVGDRQPHLAHDPARRRSRGGGRARSPRRRSGWRPARAAPRRPEAAAVDATSRPSTCTCAPRGLHRALDATVSERTSAPSRGCPARARPGSARGGSASSPHAGARRRERETAAKEVARTPTRLAGRRFVPSIRRPGRLSAGVDAWRLPSSQSRSPSRCPPLPPRRRDPRGRGHLLRHPA